MEKFVGILPHPLDGRINLSNVLLITLKLQEFTHRNFVQVVHLNSQSEKNEAATPKCLGGPPVDLDRLKAHPVYRTSMGFAGAMRASELLENVVNPKCLGGQQVNCVRLNSEHNSIFDEFHNITFSQSGFT
ncbi:hypothetical protein TNCV_3717851 [Trichonephila clavipes]|nr:hypothetical protein TNCV_3717851 [Trichonephila clavipes]